jgi:hypothetical protein
MGSAKGDDELRGVRADTAVELQRSGTRRTRRRGRRRGSPESGELELPAAEVDETSGQHDVAVGFIEAVSDHPVAELPLERDLSANSNHRADIVVAGESQSVFDDAPPARERAYDEAPPAPNDPALDAASGAASVLDAPYSLYPSAPPKGPSVWPLRIWVASMCSIIAAAGWVALREHQREQPAVPAEAPAQASAESEVSAEPPAARGSGQGASVLKPVQTDVAEPVENEPGQVAQVPPERPEQRASDAASRVPEKASEGVSEAHGQAPPAREAWAPGAEPASGAAVEVPARVPEAKRAKAPSSVPPAEEREQEAPSLPLPQNPYES